MRVERLGPSTGGGWTTSAMTVSRTDWGPSGEAVVWAGGVIGCVSAGWTVAGLSRAQTGRGTHCETHGDRH